ncbi:hypothetical protein FGG08_000746 [Glutinoglossum americanum]|uniref:Uncharacterized protein n=1 Tax=Glutinoglossum americanum TaxID=1670608 RepID=A0A9P8I894_9PEZI|nr:hypothetical protein FGG08_000746 [Glutinoglossum americanum]
MSTSPETPSFQDIELEAQHLIDEGLDTNAYTDTEPSHCLTSVISKGVPLVNSGGGSSSSKGTSPDPYEVDMASRDRMQNESTETMAHPVQESDILPFQRWPGPGWSPSSLSFDGLITYWWAWELISWLTSAASLATMAILLVLYDGKQHPVWSLGVTFNTLVSILATILKAGLLFPISQAIGQLMYLWYRPVGVKQGSEPRSNETWCEDENPKVSRRCKRLDNIDGFDEATRGPAGALQLLAITKGRHLASMGALLMLLSPGIGPFSQQLIDSTDRWTETSAYVSMNTSDQFDAKGQMYAKTTIEAALVSHSPETHALISMEQAHNCTGPELCDWPIYDTLGVCSDCQDVSDTLQPFCHEIDGRRRCGYQSGFSSGQDPSSQEYIGYLRPGENFTFMRIDNRHGLTARVPRQQWPLNSFVLAYEPTITGEGQSSPPVAMECLLYACVKRVKTMRKDNTFRNKTIEVFTGNAGVESKFKAIENTTFSDYGRTYLPTYTPYKEHIVINVPGTDGVNSSLDSFIGETLEGYKMEHAAKFFAGSTRYSSRDSKFIIRNESANRIAWVLESKLNGRAIFNRTDPEDGLIVHRTTDYLHPISDTLMDTTEDPTTIPIAVDRIARRISEALTIDLMSRGTRSSSEIEAGMGKSYKLKPHIHVRWGWICLPTFLVVATLVHVVMVMNKSIKQQVPFWKSSAKAMFLQCPRTEDPVRFGQYLRRLSRLDPKERKLFMKLVHGKEEALRFTICTPEAVDGNLTESRGV